MADPSQQQLVKFEYIHFKSLKCPSKTFRSTIPCCRICFLFKVRFGWSQSSIFLFNSVELSFTIQSSSGSPFKDSSCVSVLNEGCNSISANDLDSCSIDKAADDAATEKADAGMESRRFWSIRCSSKYRCAAIFATVTKDA